MKKITMTSWLRRREVPKNIEHVSTCISDTSEKEVPKCHTSKLTNGDLNACLMSALEHAGWTREKAREEVGATMPADGQLFYFVLGWL